MVFAFQSSCVENKVPIFEGHPLILPLIKLCLGLCLGPLVKAQMTEKVLKGDL